MPKSIKVENVNASGSSVVQIGDFKNVTNNLAAEGRTDLAQALETAQQAIVLDPKTFRRQATGVHGNTEGDR